MADEIALPASPMESFATSKKPRLCGNCREPGHDKRGCVKPLPTPEELAERKKSTASKKASEKVARQQAEREEINLKAEPKPLVKPLEQHGRLKEEFVAEANTVEGAINTTALPPELVEVTVSQMNENLEALFRAKLGRWQKSVDSGGDCYNHYGCLV